MKPQAMFSWMHSALEIRETDRYGKSVFACRHIPADTRLAVFGGYVMRIADEPVFENIGADFALQIDDEFVIGANFEADLDDAQYFNHSCNPNAGLRGQLNLVAIRDIAPDEEVTFDYAMVLYCGKGAKPYQLECACGAPSCRGIVTDDDWQRPELQARYDGYFTWFLQEKIRRLHRVAE